MSAGPEKHEHAWKLVIHIDGCHFFSSSYKCDCGAACVERSERDMGNSDSYAMVWALDDCERCQELLAGETPKHSVEVVLPK